MKEFTIIMPRDAGFAAEWLRTQFLDNFGGYTEHEATGAWKDPTGVVIFDHNAVFTVAVDDPGKHAETFRQMARTAGRMGEQQSVYLKLPSGGVEFIDTADKVPDGADYQREMADSADYLREMADDAALAFQGDA